MLSSILKSRDQQIDSDVQSDQDFDPRNTIINFDEKSQTNNFREKIEKSIRSIIYKAEEDLKSCIQSSIDDFSKKLEKQRIDSVKKIKISVQKNLEGFDIEIQIPNARNIELDTSISSILDDAIEEKTRTVTRHRRKSGAWGWLCKKFDTDDWGWKSYQRDEEYYQVDLNKISQSSKEAVNLLSVSANAALDDQIHPQLQQGVEDFFGAFREKIEHICGDLMNGIQKHSLDQAQKAAILKDSTQMAHEASDLKKDCEALNDTTTKLRRKEGVSIAKAEVLA